jgi:hypothetical protein
LELMTVSSVGGSSPGFTWSAVYDDAPNPDTVTVQADGVGRDTVVVAQADGQRAAIQFVQASGPSATPVPVDAQFLPLATTRQVVIGAGPVVINTPALKPFAPSKPGGQGGFQVLNEEWRAT